MKSWLPIDFDGKKPQLKSISSHPQIGLVTISFDRSEKQLRLIGCDSMHVCVPYIRGPHTTIRQQRLAQYSQQKVMESVEFEKGPGLDNNSTEFKEKGGLQAVYLPGFVQIFGSKLQDVFQTFFQNNYFFFQTQCYQIP